jgi:signal transduction histidine kinase/CheY-like chemotaxis protein
LANFSVLLRSAHGLVKALRLRDPLANDPTAKILNTLLVGVLCWLAFDLAVIIPLFSHRKPAAAAEALGVALIFAIALALLRRGSLRAASLVYLSAIWLLATVVVVLNAGIQSPFVVFYVVLPISAAWLLGYRAAILIAGICLASSLTMAVLEINGMPMPHYWGNGPLGTWATIVWAMIIAAVPVAQVLQIYRDALARLGKYQEHLEELVEQRTSELRAANQAKSAFLANMSHELRTPLNAILGFSTLVRDASDLKEEYRRDLEIVNRSGEHLLQLIDGVLDLAKIEAGRTVLENVPFDVSGLVAGMVEMMRVQAAAKNVELLLHRSSSVPAFVQSDAAKLRQVLINLLSNAVKFTEHGRVTLRVDAKPIDAKRTLLIFEVQDSGIGIAPEDRQRIFTPFVRVGEHATQNGTGLGLSIARQFVQMMGGTISVQSIPGEGSLFSVELPVKLAQESAVAAANVDSRQVVALVPGEPQYRILIIEDKRENWQLLQRLIEHAGFQVRVAEDGATGVEMFRTWRPHLIWMDLRLPVMGGLEAARKIRTLDGGREVKIVALTASAFVQQRDEVLAAGLDDFLGKPYRRQEIFDCMERHLGARYSYQDALRKFPVDQVLALRPEALATLPLQLRQELRDALVRLESQRIADAIDRVSQQDAELGAALTCSAERLAHTEILNALDDGNVRAAAGNP